MTDKAEDGMNQWQQETNERMRHWSAVTAGPIDDNAVERLAQWLHDEVEFPDQCPDLAWPQSETDTGQRGSDAWAKLLPTYIVEGFRSLARRMLTQLPLARPAPPATASVREALERLEQLFNSVADEGKNEGVSDGEISALQFAAGSVSDEIAALSEPAPAAPTRDEIAQIIERHVPHDEAIDMANAILALRSQQETNERMRHWSAVTAGQWPSDAEMLNLLIAAGYDTDEVHPKCYRGFGWKTFTEKLKAYAHPTPPAAASVREALEKSDYALAIAENAGMNWSAHVIKLIREARELIDVALSEPAPANTNAKPATHGTDESRLTGHDPDPAIGGDSRQSMGARQLKDTVAGCRASTPSDPAPAAPTREEIDEDWFDVTDGTTLPGDRFSYIPNVETGVGKITSHKRRRSQAESAGTSDLTQQEVTTVIDWAKEHDLPIPAALFAHFKMSKRGSVPRQSAEGSLPYRSECDCPCHDALDGDVSHVVPCCQP